MSNVQQVKPQSNASTGIPTEILKIGWINRKNLIDKQGFESLARKLRFRILGKACRDLSIDSLLLAHHEDDQAETVLMRMISGHRLAGLAGIREVSEIPENYGFYGIHESGGSNQITLEDGVVKPYRAYLKPSPKAVHHLRCEHGGIKIYRPMLGFSKARLIATCEAEEMKWFEDHTNKDPTLTTRNAIRHIYANHKMPAGLSKSSLLNLSANVKGKLAVRKAIVDSWMSTDSITGFETRSGTLAIRFPHINELESSSKWSVSEKSQIAAELLRRILMLVTPEEHVEVASLHGAVARLFPEIKVDEGKEKDAPTGFTVAGVQFQPETHHPQEPVQPTELYSEKEIYEPTSDQALGEAPLRVRPLPYHLNQPYFTEVGPNATFPEVFPRYYFQRPPIHKMTHSEKSVELNFDPDSVGEKHVSISCKKDYRKPQWFLSRQPFPIHQPQRLNTKSQMPTSGEADPSEIVPMQMSEVKLEEQRHSPEPLREELPTGSSSFQPGVTVPTVVQDMVALGETRGYGLMEGEREPSREKGPKYHHPSAPNNLLRTQAGHPKLRSHLPETPLRKQLPGSRDGQKQVTEPNSEERQPKSSKLAQRTSNKPRPLIIIPPAATRSEVIWSPWTLFDGRYWIRAQNFSDVRLLIKPFEREHLMSFKHKSPKLYRDYFQKILRTVAKGTVRWTLPVIVLDAHSWKEGRFERVIALPTLDIHIENVHELVKWEVRYKKIYLDGIPLTPALVPPVISVSLPAKRVNRAELKCTGCGLGGHIYEECWKIHPELKSEQASLNDEKFGLREEEEARMKDQGSRAIDIKRMKRIQKEKSAKKIPPGNFEKEILTRIQNHVKMEVVKKGTEREEVKTEQLEESKFNNTIETKVEAQAERMEVKLVRRIKSRGSGNSVEKRQKKWSDRVEEIAETKRETKSEVGERTEKGNCIEQPAEEENKASERHEPKIAGAARKKKWAYWVQRNQERVAKRERRRQVKGSVKEEK